MVFSSDTIITFHSRANFITQLVKFPRIQPLTGRLSLVTKKTINHFLLIKPPLARSCANLTGEFLYIEWDLGSYFIIVWHAHRRCCLPAFQPLQRIFHLFHWYENVISHLLIPKTRPAKPCSANYWPKTSTGHKSKCVKYAGDLPSWVLFSNQTRKVSSPDCDRPSIVTNEGASKVNSVNSHRLVYSLLNSNHRIAQFKQF